jgi:hopanoid biosynthesis associated RND transporter like protein HpnN
VNAKLPLIARIVAASSDRAALVVAAAVLLALSALYYTTQHFAMNTDTLDLTSPDLSWRRNKAIFDKAFPEQGDLIVAVVDGATPELAEKAAAELAARLSQQTTLFQWVRRPDAGPFFRENGLLLLPVGEVESVTKQLIAAQPFLAPLAADPSLRGVMDSLSTMLDGVREGDAKLADLDPALAAFADSLTRVADGKPAFFSWQRLMSRDAPGTRETRRIVLFRPKLDYETLMPGADASDAIRQAARDLHFDPASGVRVRLTGSVALADEEFATLTEGIAPMTAAMLIGVLLMLRLAVRSPRIIACILATTVLGLVLTAGLGLLVVRRFNLISVAFIPLFVGLGIDFAIQFSVRYRAERLVHQDLRSALVASGSTLGGSLALAAAAIAAGFFAFLPTNYLGASELGLIAGMGMAIAFLLSVTLLPALLTIARPKGEARAIGFKRLAPLDRFVEIRRNRVLTVGGVAAGISLALLPLVQFDFNPLHLRSHRTESVATLEDLMSDPDRTPNTIDVLAPNLVRADDLAEHRLSPLPEVDHTLTLSSFIPEHQQEKLALIKDASALLDLVVDPIEAKPPPADAETAHSLARAASALRDVAGEQATPAASDARRLAAALERLATGTAALRSVASEALVMPLSIVLSQLRAVLRARPVSLETLPPDLVQDWVAADGRARIQVFPKGDSNDNRVLERFAKAVRAVVPDATGAPIFMQEAARTIVGAFISAGVWSFLAITLLLAVVLRRTADVVRTLVPILLAGLLTLATCVAVGQPLNFANIIALPLLFGVGVAFNIYLVVAWRAGERNFLASSLARGVLFSALTTAFAFGSLWLSSHPGTASMGKLLMMSLGWTLVTVLLFAPALLGPPRLGARKGSARASG